MYIEVSIRTSLQVWFEDSAVGYRNRQRLVELFDALYESFDVVDGWFGGDGSAMVDIETTPYLQPLAPWTGGPSIDDTRSRYPTLAYYEAEAPGPDDPQFPGVDAFRAYLFHDRDFERLPYYEIPSYGDRHYLFEAVIREMFESDADVDRVVAAISSATGSSKHPGVVDHVLEVLTEYPDARAIDAVAPLVHTGSADQKLLALDYLIANLHDHQARAFVESVADGAADFETAESIAQDALVDLE
ncbi:hypothetical protein [Haloarchaeobius sp. DFWS5]|uniref:hypothetical protein n=1 Tax=Haloarchaeobius sp. DFWS5 TaxID=3446114 RepID=UPI003EBCA40D